MYATLIAVAALWGAATGLLIPRAAYRLSVEPDRRWRDTCPAGHTLVGPAGGWLGTPACRTCTTEAASPAPPAPPAPPGTAPASRPATAPDTTTPGSTLDATPESTPAPLRRPITAPLLTGLTCAALALATGPRPELVVWLLYAPFALLLATVDVRVHRLPDQLTLPLAAATPLLLAVAELLPYDGGSWLHALLGALVLGGGYFALFLIHPTGMGFGDVKLALSLGAALGWYGWGVLFAGTFAGFLLGALYGLGLILARRGSRTSAIPFGPFMLGGALLGLVLGALSATP
ncbi:prepilin peptidase [Streptomyces lateritius]|uniref:Prepilin peptidase n=1 Tax=Streptomyces lateritius TaxID=67313 RepID=A0ABW6YFM5_9ACTN